MQKTAPITVVETPGYLADARRILSEAERDAIVDRVVYLYHNAAMPVFLLAVFAKNEKANLTEAERNQLADTVKALIRNYGGKA